MRACSTVVFGPASALGVSLKISAWGSQDDELRQTLHSEHESRMLKNDVAHGLTVSLPNRDKLTMRF